MAGGPQLTERERKKEREREREKRDAEEREGRRGEVRGEEKNSPDDQCRIRQQSRLSLGLRFGNFFML